MNALPQRGIFGAAYFVNSRYADEIKNVEVAFDDSGELQVFVRLLHDGTHHSYNKIII